jgi:uncharacterized protein YoxC
MSSDAFFISMAIMWLSIGIAISCNQIAKAIKELNETIKNNKP